MNLLKMFRKMKYNKSNGTLLRQEYVEQLTDNGDAQAEIDYQALARAILEEQNRLPRPDQTVATGDEAFTDTVRGIIKSILSIIMGGVIVFAIGEIIGLSIIIYLEYKMEKLNCFTRMIYLAVVIASISLIFAIIWLIKRIKTAVDSATQQGSLVSFAALLLTIISVVLSIFGFWFNVIINVFHMNG